MSEGVYDLLDQRYDVKAEILRLEQELKGMKEELTQLKDRKIELGASGLSLTPVVTSSVSGLPKGASTEPDTPKKEKKGKQKAQETPWPALKTGTGVI